MRTMFECLQKHIQWRYENITEANKARAFSAFIQIVIFYNFASVVCSE